MATCGKTALVCQFASKGKDFPKTYRVVMFDACLPCLKEPAVYAGHQASA
jgi:hypothetical protein